jgi:hypothetical protein
MNSNFMDTYLAYVAETVAGTTPGSPSMKKIRTTDPLQIQGDIEQLQTEESYSHRQAVMSRNGAKSVSGNVPVELSYGAFDEWIEAVLGGSWSTETAGTPEVLKIGNAIKTFTVERGNTTNNIFERFLGVNPNSLSVTMNPAVATATFGLIGMDIGTPAGSALGSPANVANNEPFDGLGNATLQEGGSGIATVTSVQFQINNNRSIGRLLGSDAGDVPTNGNIEITGTLTARFNNQTLLNKFLNGIASTLELVLNDQAGTESLTFKFENIKYSGSQIQNNESALDISLPFTALYDASEATALTVTRSNAA